MVETNVIGHLNEINFRNSPLTWCTFYQNQCSPKEDEMPKKYKKNTSFIIKFRKGKGKHPFRCVIQSRNGNICYTSEGMLHELGPKKTLKSFIKAIQEGRYRIDEELEVDEVS